MQFLCFSPSLVACMAENTASNNKKEDIVHHKYEVVWSRNNSQEEKVRRLCLKFLQLIVSLGRAPSVFLSFARREGVSIGPAP